MSFMLGKISQLSAQKASETEDFKQCNFPRSSWQFLPTPKAVCPWPQAHQGFRLLRHLGSSKILVQQGQLLKVNFRKKEDVSRTTTAVTQVPDISGKLEMTDLVNSENIAQFLVCALPVGKEPFVYSSLQLQQLAPNQKEILSQVCAVHEA